jgi:hypothetical protein
VTYARNMLVSLNDTPHYWWKLAHAPPPFPPSVAVTRDRSLCTTCNAVGFDEYARRAAPTHPASAAFGLHAHHYSHRKECVLERLTQSSQVFAIDDSHACEKCR